MLRLYQLESIADRLRHTTTLVDQQAGRSLQFPEQTVGWLRSIEDVLQEARQPAVGTVASLRSRLLRTMHGDGQAKRSHKRNMAVASEVLMETQHLLTRVIESATAQYEEAESLAQQAVSVARIKGYITTALRAPDHASRVASLLASIQQDPDTRAAVVRLIGLVGPFDVLVVIDKATPELI